MSFLWIPFTLFAAFMQSWRNALQKQLRQHASTMGVTLARFIFALPLAVIYLISLYYVFPNTPIPRASPTLFRFILFAALAQIAATAFMVMLFKKRNYAIGVGLAKSEAVIAAALGALFFAAPLSLMAWFGVIVGAIAVWLLSRVPGQHISLETVSIGLASGLGFALCTLYIREAALLLQERHALNFLISAAWVLCSVILTQTILLIGWIALREPATFRHLKTHKTLTIGVSLFSFFGSIGWFTAMSLQTVALVKTLGQIEVLFTLAISAWWFKETLSQSDYLGLLLIVCGALLVILA